MRSSSIFLPGLLAAYLFVSCGPQSVELQENFSVRSTYRPGDLLGSINSAQVNEAIKEGRDTGIEALMQKWKIKVYSIEKKNYDSLTVHLNEDTYSFAIK